MTGTIAIVQGTRPEIIKNYSLVKSLRELGSAFVVLDTGQHSDQRMSADIYRQMGYEPTIRRLHPYRIGAAIDWLRDEYRRLGIAHVVVNGDTAASIAGAVAALYSDIDLSHVEAGLRANDDLMIEEKNRIMVDSLARNLFAYTDLERLHLLSNPDIRGAIHLLGNTTVDVLHDFAPRFDSAPRSGRYYFATLHRKEFTDSPGRMSLVFNALEQIASTIAPVVLPIHPRTSECANRAGIDLGRFRNIEFRRPCGLFESLALQKHAVAVITDSGCVQEEAYLLGTPCITVRENTERHLTVVNGANVLTGFSRRRIFEAVAASDGKSGEWAPIYGTPGVGMRIAGVLSAVVQADHVAA